MCTRDDLHAELSLLVAVPASICEQGGEPSTSQIDERGMDSDG
jgi:hypothetical protein